MMVPKSVIAHFHSYGIFDIDHIEDEFIGGCAVIKCKKSGDIYLGTNSMQIKDACGVHEFIFPGIDRSDVKTPIDLITKYINSLK